MSASTAAPAPTGVRVRTTVLRVRITPLSGPDAGTPVLDPTAYAASCSFGFDQRYSEATVRRTGGGTIEIAYWSPIEITMGTDPPSDNGPDVRFRGYVVPIDNALFPIENVLHCRGRLYKAAWVRNQTPGGTRMADPATGTSDQEQVKAVLAACGVPHDPGNIGGTGKTLGMLVVDAQQRIAPNPFVWQEGQSGLDYIEQLDAVSVHDIFGSSTGACFRTVESLSGIVFRAPFATAPADYVEASFTEGVDVLDARIARDPAGSANRVTVSGGPDPVHLTVPEGTPEDVDVAFTSACRFTVTSAFAPYLPPGLLPGPGTADGEHPDGFPVVSATFSSPMIEKSLRDDPLRPEDVVSCQAVADYLLGEYNTVVDTLDFSTPRDVWIGPGSTIHLHSPRLGLTDPERHYWIQHLEIEVDERGAFTQRIRALRKS